MILPSVSDALPRSDDFTRVCSWLDVPPADGPGLDAWVAAAVTVLCVASEGCVAGDRHRERALAIAAALR